MDFYAELEKLKSVHRNMFSRCYNIGNESFKYYGACGIFVCDEWKNQKTLLLEIHTE